MGCPVQARFSYGVMTQLVTGGDHVQLVNAAYRKVSSVASPVIARAAVIAVIPGGARVHKFDLYGASSGAESETDRIEQSRVGTI